MARAITAEGHRLIRAPVQRVWHLLSRLESHPRYITLWLAADLHERSPTSALVEFRGFFGGLPIVSTQRFTLRPPARIEFRQVRGELRDLAGAYLLKDVDGETDLIVQVSTDPGIPLFSEASVRQILAGHIDGTLTRIKASAERDLVRLTPRRGRATGTRSPAPEPPAVAGDLREEAPPAAPQASELATEVPTPRAGAAAAVPSRQEGSEGGVVETASGPPSPPSGSGAARGPERRRRRRRRRRAHGQEGGRVPPAIGG